MLRSPGDAAERMRHGSSRTVVLATLATLVLLTLLTLTLACGSDPEPKSPLQRMADAAPSTGVKILLVGIDGATLKILQPLVDDGRVPTFAGLLERGSSGTLLSEKPLYSPAIWTTIATGVSREEHAIKRFRVARGERMVSSIDRQRLALWNLTSAFGRSTGVIGWWASWPAEEVQGWNVSDRLARGRWAEWTGAVRDGWLTWPPELVEQLGPLVVDPDDAPYDEISTLADFDEAELAEMRSIAKPIRRHWLGVLKFAYCAQRSYEKMALQLLADGQPELTQLFLVANDPVSHTFWHFYEPDAFGDGVVDPDAARRLGRAVPGMYEHNDRYLAELLPLVDEETVVIVVSDHGFQASGELPSDEPVDENQDSFTAGLPGGQVTIGQSGVHALDGLFLAAGGPVIAGVRVEASIYDVAPTVLALLGMPVPDDMTGRVLEEIVDPGFWEAHPIQRIPTYEGFVEREPFDAESIPDDSEALEMLRALGYIK